jgi:Hint domain
MTAWIALSGYASPGLAPHGPDLRRGGLVFDIALPLSQPTLLLDASRDTASLKLFQHPETGFSLVHRQRHGCARHHIVASVPGYGPVQLHFEWTETGAWTLSIVRPAGEVARVSGLGTLPMPQALLAQVCSSATRASALRWVGLPSKGVPCPATLLGPLTPIATPTGPVAANWLLAGDLVMTRDGVAVRLSAIRRHLLPGDGMFEPVRLRAPFFGAGSDLLVSGTQKIAMTGVDVEYLFGEDTVLVTARDLADGTRARLAPRPGLLPWVELDTGQNALILSGACRLALGPHEAEAPGAIDWPRCLEPHETRALVAMKAQRANRSVA